MQCCRSFINIRKLPRASQLRTFTTLLNSRKISNRMYCPLTQISIATSLNNQLPGTSQMLYCIKLSTASNEEELVDVLTFEKVCDETLDSLTEYLEELIESAQHLNSTDVTYSSGVLTVSFGSPYGTYVINRQSPNRQIWLSSPSSGPKRYDYITKGSYWIYKHDGKSLHQLLQEEIPKIVKTKVDFSKCSHSLV